MRISKSLLACSAALVMGTALLAADSGTAGRSSDSTAAPRHAHVRLTKPWNQLKDLTEDEKAKILEIHQKAVDEVKAIDAREHQDILAVLTDEQKKEVATIEEKDKEAQRASRRKATTQPAAAASNEK